MQKLPTLKSLRAFEAAARLGSFTRAAEELCLAQSAVSRQVRGLEDQLGARLFDLIRQRIVLTQAGRAYLEEIRPVLANLEAASTRVSARAKGVELIEMATLPTFCSRWLIPRLPKFYVEHPQASIRLTSKFDPFSFDAEPFDIAIHFGTPDWAGTRMYHMFDERMVAICSPDFLRRHNIRSDADLAAAPLLHLSLRRTAWVDWCTQLSISTRNAYSGWLLDQFSMLTEAAVAGLGAALLPDLFVEEELRRGKLVLASTSAVESSKGYYIAIPENRPTAPIVTELCAWILREAEQTLNASHSATYASDSGHELPQRHNVVPKRQQPPKAPSNIIMK